MSTLVKTVLVAATLALTPYAGGANSLKPMPQVATVAAPAAKAATAGHSANPWAVFGLALSVMVLGAIRRR